MRVTDRVKEILSWYPADNPGTRAALGRLMMSGRLAGTGRMVILPVDQGFEHGPDRSFAPNPGGYDAFYHPDLAVESGCNGYAAPLGLLEAAADRYPGTLPLILKVNNSDSLGQPDDAWSAITSTVDDALRLGCSAIGFTIYPGSDHRNDMYGEIREMTSEAKSKGLAVIIWSYPRGNHLDKAGETAIDVIAYGAHIACQLGAHIVKVKPPTEVLSQAASKKAIEAAKIPVATFTDRVRHVVKCCYAGRRIVIFSGGEAKDNKTILGEIKGIRDGGGFGSIVGRNAFQRPRADGLALLKSIIDIYV